MEGLFHHSGIITADQLSQKISLLNQMIRGLKACGRIACLPNSGTAYFVGDLHGDLEAVVSIIRQTNFLEDMREKKDTFLVFLGDYGDRGDKTIETINEVISLKLKFPENIILLRGNHEEADVAKIFGTRDDFTSSYGVETGKQLLEHYCDTMKELPVVLISANGIVAMHGGIPNSDIESIDVLNGKEGELYAREMTWNDPNEKIRNRMESERGVPCKDFGEKAFLNFMKAIPAKLLVRSHEAVSEGVKLMFNKRLATIFSNGSRKSTSSYFKNLVKRPVFMHTNLSMTKDQFDMDDFIEVCY